MGKGKLQKFKEMEQMPNLFQNYDFKKPSLFHLGEDVLGKHDWQIHFGNKNPIVIELACGKGEYTLALAERFPDKNVIGIDIKGARIWRGAKTAEERGLKNVAFLRIKIEQIGLFFNQNDISDFWISFPDPFHKRSAENNRLTSSVFLERYRKVGRKGSTVSLKTDSLLLLEYSKKVAKLEGLPIHHIEYNLRNWGSKIPMLTEVTTFYEKSHIEEGRPINFIEFSLHP